VIEGQGRGQVPGGEDVRGGGIVGGLKFPLPFGEKDRRNSVPSLVPGRIGVAVKLADQAYGETGFLSSLPDRRCLEALTGFNETSRQGPARGRVFPPDKDNASTVPENEINCRDGVFLSAHRPLPGLEVEDHLLELPPPHEEQYGDQRAEDEEQEEDEDGPP